jgi:single-stranded-DNA-specific exonuclease
MRWNFKPEPPSQKVAELSNALQTDPLIAQLLLQRGIETFEQARTFFRPSLDDLHDPFLMKDMEKAVERIKMALEQREGILVYGDYDVDGTCSVALMATFLRTLSDRVATYIPDRYSEGYGLSFAGIDFAADNDIKLIIALDCGIKAIDKVAYASKKGVDIIICDHHRPGADLPSAVAVLDPKRNDCPYPYKELCGCGVGFKLVQALAITSGISFDDLFPLLDLVVTAIGADIVPITGENRVLAYYGLNVLNTAPRPGFRAILAQVKKKQIDITDVVFILAPRINAAGRMEHGDFAVALLTSPDLGSAQQVAATIEQFNTDRRDTDKRITSEALQQILENGEEHRMSTVVYNENWHKGVVGIVASRLIETYYRPTLVFTKSGNKLAASARSVKGFDVYNALELCAEHIEQFGGHKYAAGLTLSVEQYEPFKEAFERVVAQTIEPDQLTPEIGIDAEITLDRINPKFYRILKQFAPFGPGNMRPVFCARALRDTGTGKCVGADDSHLRLVVRQEDSSPFTAIGFGLGDKLPLAKDNRLIDAAFTLDENEWQGQVSLQLRLKDIAQSC